MIHPCDTVADVLDLFKAPSFSLESTPGDRIPAKLSALHDRARMLGVCCPETAHLFEVPLRAYLALSACVLWHAREDKTGLLSCFDEVATFCPEYTNSVGSFDHAVAAFIEYSHLIFGDNGILVSSVEPFVGLTGAELEAALLASREG